MCLKLFSSIIEPLKFYGEGIDSFLELDEVII